MSAVGPTIHATAVVVGETGVLLRGPSGAGKSAVALALIEFGARRGLFVRLVADDRVMLSQAGGRLVAAPHPAIAGQIERRGHGIEARPHLGRAVVGLVADVAAEGPRLPADADLRASLEGVELPRMTVGADPLAAAAAILARLQRLPERR